MKTSENQNFLIFSGGIERDQYTESILKVIHMLKVVKKSRNKCSLLTISSQCSISIPPENVRILRGFLTFSRGIAMGNWARVDLSCVFVFSGKLSGIN